MCLATDTLDLPHCCRCRFVFWDWSLAGKMVLLVLVVVVVLAVKYARLWLWFTSLVRAVEEVAPRASAAEGKD